MKNPHELLEKAEIKVADLSSKGKEAISMNDEMQEQLKEFPDNEMFIKNAEQMANWTYQELEKEIKAMKKSAVTGSEKRKANEEAAKKLAEEKKKAAEAEETKKKADAVAKKAEAEKKLQAEIEQRERKDKEQKLKIEKAQKAKEFVKVSFKEMKECKAVLDQYRKQEKEKAGTSHVVRRKLTTRLRSNLKSIANMIPKAKKEDADVLKKTERAINNFVSELKSIWGMNTIKPVRDELKDKFKELKERAEKKEEKTIVKKKVA